MNTTKAILFPVCLILGILTSKAQTNIFPANGDVGIGTVTPSAWFPGKVLEFADWRPILKLSPFTDGGLATILFKGAYSNTSGTTDEFHLNYVSSTTNPRIVLSAYQSGGAVAFAVLGNGNVGIGTESPAEKLSVNGNLRAKEVKVEAVNWPDYVFKPDYELLKLSEIKAYTDQYHHLPDLPSAAEVAREGINLGEMNAKLLRKVEELTLHLVEKEQELHRERARIDVQQKTIDQVLLTIKRLEKTSRQISN